MDEYVFPRAIKALSNGEVIVYPTDTLYGLGADIFNDDAVTKVFKIKNRPFDQPISIAVSSVNEIDQVAFIDEKIKNFAEVFLPGSITLILMKKDVVSDLVTGGLDKVAVRIPDNRFSHHLTSVFGPLTCTSANVHGKSTPSVIKDISMQLKDSVSVYIDDGKLEGKPSTIIDFTGDKPEIVREGAVSKKDIMDAIKNG